MPYATYTDVALEFKSLDLTSGAAAVKSGTVDEWCNQASNLIDSYVGGKYRVPVSAQDSPSAFSVLKMICVALVTPRVASATGTQTGIAKTTQAPGGRDSSSNSDPVKAAKEMLKDIQSGAMKLTDGVLATEADGVESNPNGNSGTPLPPKFTRESDDW